jgi:tRNA U54 and U55 pseudouridine synthase Pus10
MANLGKILAIDSDFAFRTILSSEFSQIRCNSVFLFGYYVKYSRYLSQTPWMVNGNKLAESSIQE